ncbi:hypothetical protein FN846DRAFT_897474 [Sphaerosporella brunnea]|uniref:F-box domain-containing protein n=1 Tax=Sphaerosporella brunnea TaxID=1250544 RepID=A0A5J5F7B1_9PEZI|nr:hypothetical protein FN846DRAFT_897474 [Sphaerosporella brunnea]
MPRPRIFSRGNISGGSCSSGGSSNIWDTPAGRKLPEDSKSRRRRLWKHITRFTSSPTLPRSGTRTPDPKSSKRSVSCISLASGNSEELAGAALAEYDGFGYGSDSSLDLFVDCDDGSGGTAAPRYRRQGPTWEDLPDEVKVNVLSWCEPRELVQMSSVSKEFHRLCYDGQLWKTLDASEFYNRIPVGQLARLIVASGNFVRHLNLRGCVQLHKDWRLETVANACRNLLSASLEGCTFDRPIIHFIIMRNPQLVDINLSGLQAVTNSTCRMLAHSCPHIESLNVSFCTNMDGRGLRRVVEACKNLRELRACELQISEAPLMQALFKANTVERLQFGESVGITDEHIRLLVEGAEPEIDPFTDRNAAPARKLVHLDLRKCTLLTDNALRYLSGNVPNLEKLELGAVVSLTDAGLAQLLPTVPRLSELDIEECLELTNTTLFNIAKSPAASKLQDLHVSYCENMGDSGMIEVLRKCDSLWNLEVDNTQISDFTLLEATRVLRERPVTRPVTSCPTSHFGLRMVVFDCSNIRWTGVREVLNRNAEYMKTQPAQPGMIRLKCYYEYQKTVDEHTKLVLRKDVEKADRLEREWAAYMMASQEGSAGRRRRRAWGDEDDNGRRRSGRVGMCAIM